jgi:lipopolysaccharide export system protein LptC
LRQKDAQGGSMRSDPTGSNDRDASEDFSRRALPRSQASRTRAFSSAARHSARVRWLRRLILGGAALTTVGVIGYSWLRPLDRGDTHFSLEGIGVSGDKVTMAHPKMTGVRRDGRPYEVVADSGVQNPRDPTRTTLYKLDARLHLSDDGETRVIGDTGIYDANAQTLDLDGHVHIKGASFDLAMQGASMNFKTNAMDSKTPVRLDMDSGWILADAMSMKDNGEQITFSGNVQSHFTQRPEQDAADSDPKGH